MSARGEQPQAAAEAGKDTPAGATSTHAGAAETAPAFTPLTDEFLDHLRKAGLRLPQRPVAGRAWMPRTEAERQLLTEARRLDRARRLLLDHIGWLYRAYAERAVEKTATAWSTAPCPLTLSELRVLVGAASGEAPRDTARRLLLAYDTVKGQRVSAQRRLGARSIPHAVAMATAAGWITPAQITGGVTP